MQKKSPMAISDQKAPVFIDTGLGTHLAMDVSPDITAGDLKRKLGSEHSICFPNLGEIRITALMVKRRSFSYHLTDSVPVKNVFQGLEGTWFLYVDAMPLNDFYRVHEPEGLTAECRASVSNSSGVINSKKPEDHITCIDKVSSEKSAGKKKREGSSVLDDVVENLERPVEIADKDKKRKNKKSLVEKVVDESKEKSCSLSEEIPCLPLQEQFYCNDTLTTIDHDGLTSETAAQTPIASPSEAVSISGILTKYFPGFDEATSFDSSPGCDVNATFGSYISHQGYQAPPRTEAIDHCSEMLVDKTPPSAVNTSPTLSLPQPVESNPVTLRHKLGKTKVGKHILIETNDDSSASVSLNCHEGRPLKTRVNEHSSKVLVDKAPQFARETPPSLSHPPPPEPNPVTTRRKIGRKKVAKCLSLEENDIGIFTSKKKSFIASCQSKHGKKSSSLVKNHVSEIGCRDDLSESVFPKCHQDIPLNTGRNKHCTKMPVVNIAQSVKKTPAKLSHPPPPSPNPVTTKCKLGATIVGKFSTNRDDSRDSVSPMCHRDRHLKTGTYENCQKMSVDKTAHSVQKTPPKLSHPPPAEPNWRKLGGTKVGDHSVVAENKLRISTESGKKPTSLVKNHLVEVDNGDDSSGSVSHNCHQGRSLKTKRNRQCSKRIVRKRPRSSVKTPPPVKSNPASTRNKFGRTEFGKRFVVAVNDLGVSTSKEKSLLPVFQYKSRKTSPSLIKKLVFEISDSEAASYS